MRRLLKIAIGSALSAMAGFAIGLVAADLYVRRYYPNDPDPVDFTIGALLLLSWIGVWVAGTVVSVWLAFRKQGIDAA